MAQGQMSPVTAALLPPLTRWNHPGHLHTQQKQDWGYSVPPGKPGPPCFAQSPIWRFPPRKPLPQIRVETRKGFVFLLPPDGCLTFVPQDCLGRRTPPEPPHAPQPRGPEPPRPSYSPTCLLHAARPSTSRLLPAPGVPEGPLASAASAKLVNPSPASAPCFPCSLLSQSPAATGRGGSEPASSVGLVGSEHVCRW